MTFKRLGHRRLASGVFLHLDRRYLIDTDGKALPRDVVRHPGGVAVLPVQNGKVWLVSQFRTAVERRVLEIPAGKLDPFDNHLPTAALRELAEEVGASADAVIHLTTMFPSPGYTDEAIHIFAATGLTFGDRRPGGAEELNSEIVTFSIEDALLRIDAGEINDSKTQVALLLWARRRSSR